MLLVWIILMVADWRYLPTCQVSWCAIVLDQSFLAGREKQGIMAWEQNSPMKLFTNTLKLSEAIASYL